MASFDAILTDLFEPPSDEYTELIKEALKTMRVMGIETTTGLRDFWITAALPIDAHEDFIRYIEKFLNAVSGVELVKESVEAAAAEMDDDAKAAAAGRSATGSLPDASSVAAKIIAQNRCMAVLLGTLYFAATEDPLAIADPDVAHDAYIEAETLIEAFYESMTE